LSVRSRGKSIISLLGACFYLFSCFCAYAQKDSTAKKHRLLILPVIARSIETNWSFGAAVSSTFHLLSPVDSLTRTSNIQGLVLYTLRKQFVAAISGSIYFPGEKWILSEQISYSYFPDKFWGLGDTTSFSSEEPYAYKQFYVYLHPQRSLGNSLFLGFRYEYQQVWDIQYDSGGLFDKENILGRYPYHISGLGLSFTYDTRNNAFSPDRGSMLQFYYSHFDPVFGSNFQYSNYVIDMRKFLKLYKQQVLAFQAYGFFNSGDVPLRSLASLGGSNSMRGYYNGRYRDKNMVVLQTEYRMPLFWRLGAVVFGDCGNVAPILSDINFQYIKYSFGGGLRFALNKDEKLNLRLDYGVSHKASNGFYLQIGEAF
jgi:outer membrane protein assembly factor BamA